MNKTNSSNESSTSSAAVSMSAYQKHKANRSDAHQSIICAASEQKPTKGAHTRKVVSRALAVAGLSHLDGQTLIDDTIRSIHVEDMKQRIHALFSGATKNLKGADAEQRARERLRFVTVIHSVDALNVDCTIAHAKTLKQEMTATLGQLGLGSVGVVELEVVSAELMGLSQSDRADSFQRKKKVIADLTPPVHQSDTSLCMVHYHGVIDLGNNPNEEHLRRTLKQNQHWGRTGYQVEVKQLSEHWGGNRKSVLENLDHIAAYITKGGNKFKDGQVYMEYKLTFDQGDLDYEAELVAGWKTHPELQREQKEKGLENPLSMTYADIAFAIEAIDQLMQVGYVIASQTKLTTRR